MEPVGWKGVKEHGNYVISKKIVNLLNLSACHGVSLLHLPLPLPPGKGIKVGQIRYRSRHKRRCRLAAMMDGARLGSAEPPLQLAHGSFSSFVLLLSLPCLLFFGDGISYLEGVLKSWDKRYNAGDKATSAGLPASKFPGCPMSYPGQTGHKKQ